MGDINFFFFFGVCMWKVTWISFLVNREVDIVKAFLTHDVVC